jgi:hypothetical protein
MRLGGPQSRSARYEEVKNLFFLLGIEPRSSSSKNDPISGVTEKPKTSPDAQKVAYTIIQQLNPAVQKAGVVYDAPGALAFHLFRLVKSRLVVFKGNYFVNKMCMMKV